VRLQLTVGGTLWEQVLQPFSDIDLPTEAHQQAVLPYLRDFKLAILGTEPGPPRGSSAVAIVETVHVPTVTTPFAAAEPSPPSAPPVPPLASTEDDDDVVSATQMWAAPSEETAALAALPPALLTKTRAELKQLCYERGLNTGGNRQELLTRLAKGQ
jgi:hypothetical protein